MRFHDRYPHIGLDVVRWLVSHGGARDLREPDAKGFTPLQNAVYAKKRGVVDYLMGEHGVEPGPTASPAFRELMRLFLEDPEDTRYDGHEKKCANCGKVDNEVMAGGNHIIVLKACSRCLAVFYCSLDCQRHHWQVGGHKAKCKELRKHRKLNVLENQFRYGHQQHQPDRSRVQPVREAHVERMMAQGFTREQSLKALMQTHQQMLARRSSAEHLIATKALRCTATARILIVAESFAKF